MSGVDDAPVLLAREDEARAWIENALAPTAGQWTQLETFAAILRRASVEQNLIAASTLDSMWTRHIADSAQLLRFDTRAGNGVWFDLGSGAGLPGIIAAILTERPIWLLESRKLRCAFLREACEALGVMPRVRVVESRLETLSTHAMATISARAFAPLPKLIAASARFSTKSSVWLLPKGRNAVKELAELPASWQTLFHVEQSLTDAESAILVGTGTVHGQQRGPK